MKRSGIALAAAAFFAVLLLSAARLCSLRIALAREQCALRALDLTELTVEEISSAKRTSVPPTSTPLPLPTPENEERFGALLERNGDFAAWLTVEGTEIDYPVMRGPEKPDYYLTHDFDGNESHSGTPYIGKNCDTGSDNVIIYGHNMKNGTMFADLLRYRDAAFFAAHPTIRFDTVERSGEYEILAVFREKVHYQDEQGVFRYYDYAGALTEEQFRAYTDQIRAISLYDTGCTAVYGRQLITLSTCAYHTENGRFVVVAQRCE